MLAALLPDEPEVHGLLALLELTAARFPARTGPDGEPVLLEDQDRRRWDRSAIRRGRAALATAGRRRPRARPVRRCRPRSPTATRSRPRSRRPTGTGSCCSTRRSAGSRRRRSSSSTGPSRSRWPTARRRPCPIVDELVAADRAAGSHLLPSVRGELLTRLGRTAEARAELELAARLCGNEPRARRARAQARRAGRCADPPPERAPAPSSGADSAAAGRLEARFCESRRLNAFGCEGAVTRRRPSRPGRRSGGWPAGWCGRSRRSPGPAAR